MSVRGRRSISSTCAGCWASPPRPRTIRTASATASSAGRPRRAAGAPQQLPRVGLDCVKRIEIEAYAAELARVTLWIGDLQWMLKNGFRPEADPILSPLT